MRLLCLLVVFASPDDDLATLVDRLGETDYAVSNRAYQVLSQKKDARVVALIGERIAKWQPYQQYRALTLVGVFPPRESHPLYERLLKSDDAHLRVAAAAQLHRRGERGMEKVIVDVLANPPAEDELRDVTSRLTYLRLPAVYEAWCKLITPAREETTLGLWFGALSREGFTGAQAQAKRILEKDGRDGARAIAAAYLVRCGDASHAPVLAELMAKLDSGTISRVRYTLRDGGVYPDEVCAAVVERLPDESSSYIAKALIEMLTEARYHAARKALAALVGHEDADIAEAALAALASLQAAPDKAALQRMLESDDKKKRLSAARVLNRMDDGSGFEAVLQIAKEAKGKLRGDAVEVLGEFRRPEAVDTLLDAMADDDATVRSYASRGLQATLQTLFPFRRFDYSAFHVGATASQRATAIGKIRAWWNKHRDAAW